MKAKKIVADFAAALARLTQALAAPAENDLVRAGCIQYFEFCVTAQPVINRTRINTNHTDVHR